MLEQGRFIEAAASGRARKEGPPPADELNSLRSQLARQALQLEAFEQRWMEAMERSQRQSDILAHYAHDLRSPLSAIMGYADLLAMGVPESIPDCAAESVSRIREAAQDLHALLDRLLAPQGAIPELR